MPRDAGCLTDGDINCDTTLRIEPPCAHQSFMDASESKPFYTEKQAIDSVNSSSMPGLANANATLWENQPNFQAVSGQFTSCLFGSQTVSIVDFADESNPTVGERTSNMEKKGFDNQFVSNSSVGLSILHSAEDLSSRSSCGGIKKITVNQVGNSENGRCELAGNCFNMRDNNTIPVSAPYGKVNGISLDPIYNGMENIFPMDPAFNRADHRFISEGDASIKGYSNFMLMGQKRNREEGGIFLLDQPFAKAADRGRSMAYQFENQKSKDIDADCVPMSPTFGNTNGNSIFSSCSHDKEIGNIISIIPTTERANTSGIIGASLDKANSSILPEGEHYTLGNSSTISFGGFQDEPETNPSTGTIVGYNLLTGQPFYQTMNAVGQEDSVRKNAIPIESVAPAAISRVDTTPISKEPEPTKEVYSNNFPPHVKSLLSTGILDGVPVKYVSWSREKNLRGIIKGGGYLCGCKECKFSKILSAYEFERHADCKTKHPNNHIYFENGKSIYSVVAELKNTPRDQLFEAIKNATGSPINQKKFREWKVFYLAANRKLQHNGNDEAIMPS
ncbi:hypothetical protein NMG60_11012525 [Bertholletia excelsa]